MSQSRVPISQRSDEAPEPLKGNVFVSAYPPFSCWTPEIRPAVQQRLESSSAGREHTPLGLYVHIPFCLERCEYCYYRSYAHPSASTIEAYLEALVTEWDLYHRLPAVRHRPLQFAYFGGGTPSLLEPDPLRRLLQSLRSRFDWSDSAEFTFECSPKTASSERLEILRNAGVTRLSMGVQQLDDDVLRKAGRVHLSADVRRAYDAIRQFDFPIVNLDLIVGLVGETDDTFFGSLEEVLSLSPESITIYQLEIPPNTPLYRSLESQQADLPASWEVKRCRLGTAFERMESAGYTVRSAYAAVRDPARHAFLYQELQYRGADLLGTGLTAFSYLGGVHYQNSVSLRQYHAEIASGRIPCGRGYELNTDEQAVRELVLQLKLGHVSLNELRTKYGFDAVTELSEPLERLRDAGWLQFDEDQITVTREGLLRIDHLLPSLYLPRHRQLSYW